MRSRIRLLRGISVSRSNLIKGTGRPGVVDLSTVTCPICFRASCKSQEPQERKNNPPNGSLEMIQDQPIQQSRRKELNPTNGRLWICSSPTFCGTVGSGTTFAAGLEVSTNCRLWNFARGSLACRHLMIAYFEIKRQAKAYRTRRDQLQINQLRIQSWVPIICNPNRGVTTAVTSRPSERSSANSTINSAKPSLWLVVRRK